MDISHIKIIKDVLKNNFEKYRYSYLGKGTYAKLFKIYPSTNSTDQTINMKNIDTVNDKSIKKKFAIKVFCGDDFGIPHSLITELCNTNGIGCKNIIEYSGMLHHKGNKSTRYMLIMDCYKGDMKKFKREVSFKYRMKHLYEITYKLLIALYAIKKNKILHRDIKPENVLMGWKRKLSKCPDVCLIDFGLSKKNLYGDKWKKLYTDVYTIWYRPPEIACQTQESYGKYDYKADMWALGCTLYNYICGKPLIKGNDMRSYLGKIRRLVGDTNLEYNPNWTNTLDVKHEIYIRKLFQKILGEIHCNVISKSYITLLSKMLKIDPKERISVEEALMDPILLPYGGINNSNFDILKQSYSLSNYLSTSTTINYQYKCKVLKWLMKLSCKGRFKIAYFIMAIDIFDRYSSKNTDKISHNNIKLYLTVCLGLAYKYNESSHFNIHRITDHSDYDYNLDAYIEVELDVYKTIGYNIYNSELCVVLTALKSTTYCEKELYDIFEELIPSYYTMVEEITYTKIEKEISLSIL